VSVTAFGIGLIFTAVAGFLAWLIVQAFRRAGERIRAASEAASQRANAASLARVGYALLANDKELTCDIRGGGTYLSARPIHAEPRPMFAEPKAIEAAPRRRALMGQP
jgi:hypothetical protein